MPGRPLTPGSSPGQAPTLSHGRPLRNPGMVARKTLTGFGRKTPEPVGGLGTGSASPLGEGEERCAPTQVRNPRVVARKTPHPRIESGAGSNPLSQEREPVRPSHWRWPLLPLLTRHWVRYRPLPRGAASGRSFEDEGRLAKVSTGRGSKSRRTFGDSGHCAQVSGEGEITARLVERAAIKMTHYRRSFRVVGWHHEGCCLPSCQALL